MQRGSEVWTFLKVRLQMGRAVDMALAIVPTIQKPDYSKSEGFFCGFQIVFDKMAAMVGLPHFRSHLKSRPFAAQPLIDHSKFRLVRISYPHCNYKVL